MAKQEEYQTRHMAEKMVHVPEALVELLLEQFLSPSEPQMCHQCLYCHYRTYISFLPPLPSPFFFQKTKAFRPHVFAFVCYTKGVAPVSFSDHHYLF
jgi:hypothetical protein